MIKYCFFLLAVPFSLFSAELELKEKIALTQKKLESAPNEKEKSSLQVELSLYYFEDQDIDKAFHHFLLALKSAPSAPFCELLEDEKKFYEEALELYLTTGSDPEKLGSELLLRYKEISMAHPEYIHLNFLMAIAHANLGQFQDFFKLFYKFYPSLRDSFLAYKTQGILYLRLSQRTGDFSKKISLQKEAHQLMKLALERNPKDPSLYKILITFAKEDKNEALILSYLKKMLNSEAHINRGDIYFYVREATLLREYDIAQKIIDSASCYYEYSRSLSQAQEYLNEHRRM